MPYAVINILTLSALRILTRAARFIVGLTSTLPLHTNASLEMELVVLKTSSSDSLI